MLGGRLGDVVDVVVTVGVGELLGGVVLDLGQDQRGEGGGLRGGGGGALGEDGAVVRYAGTAVMKRQDSGLLEGRESSWGSGGLTIAEA